MLLFIFSWLERCLVCINKLYMRSQTTLLLCVFVFVLLVMIPGHDYMLPCWIFPNVNLFYMHQTQF